jgi:hypothetical protein
MKGPTERESIIDSWYLDGVRELHVVPLVVLFHSIIAAESRHRYASLICLLVHKVRTLGGKGNWIPIMAGYGTGW